MDCSIFGSMGETSGNLSFYIEVIYTRIHSSIHVHIHTHAHAHAHAQTSRWMIKYYYHPRLLSGMPSYI